MPPGSADRYRQRDVSDPPPGPVKWPRDLHEGVAHVPRVTGSFLADPWRIRDAISATFRTVIRPRSPRHFNPQPRDNPGEFRSGSITRRTTRVWMSMQLTIDSRREQV